MMKKIIFFLSIAALIVLMGFIKTNAQSTDTVVLIDGRSPESNKAKEYLLPYLDHFNIPYKVIDLDKKEFDLDLKNFSLVILGHPGLNTDASCLSKLNKCLAEGIGIVSFDPAFTTGSDASDNKLTTIKANTLKFRTSLHYITQLHGTNDSIRFFNQMSMRAMNSNPSNVLISANNKPFLSYEKKMKANIVHWAGLDWMQTRYCGPLMGLDDCLWRSFVWAARKPICDARTSAYDCYAG